MQAAIGTTLKARLVHRSEITPAHGGDSLVKLMLNVQPEGRRFEPGQELGFVPPGETAAAAADNLRRYSIEQVSEVPFEDTLDLTLFVRSHGADPAHSLTAWLRGLETQAELEFYGPFKYPFYPPSGSRSNIVMLGAGCGVVPFRWLARKIHARGMDWMGNVIMLEGDQTGLDHLYLNSASLDVDQYFDKQTHGAFEALKTRYSATTLDNPLSIEANMNALLRMLSRGSVYVYRAGYRSVAAEMDKRLTAHLRLQGRWAEMRQALVDAGHWQEYLYG